MSGKRIELHVVDQAPEFCLLNKDNKKVCLKDFKGKNVIIYFYPKDNTPGCTIESIGFTNILPEFEKLDAVVIGISPDSPKSHAKFAEKKKLLVTLLSDIDKEVLKLYGAWGKNKFRGNEYIGVIRNTYLIDSKGQIVHIWPKVRVKRHAEEVKNVLSELLAIA